MVREVNARATRPRSRVWRGGSSSSIEWASSAAKGARCGGTGAGGASRPKRRSLRMPATVAIPAATGMPYSSHQASGPASRSRS